MEVPGLYIIKRKEGMAFYDDLKKQAELLKMRMIKAAFYAMKGGQERDILVKRVERFCDGIVIKVEETGKAYYDNLSSMFKIFHTMDEHDMSEDDETHVRLTYKACNSYKDIKTNNVLQLLAKLSSETCYADEEFSEVSDIFFDGVNGILEQNFGCRMNKASALKESKDVGVDVEVHPVKRYPVFDENGKKIVTTDWQPEANK